MLRLPEIVWLSELNCNRLLTPQGLFSAEFFPASPRTGGVGGLSAAGRGSVFKPIPEVDSIISGRPSPHLGQCHGAQIACP